MEVTSREFQREIGKHIEVAASGEPVTILRHGRPQVVMIQHEEWERLTFSEPRWRSILDKIAKSWESRKTDHELLCDLLIHWELNQRVNGGKTDLIYALLYMTMKDGDVTVDEAKAGATFVRNAWKGEVQP